MVQNYIGIDVGVRDLLLCHVLVSKRRLERVCNWVHIDLNPESSDGEQKLKAGDCAQFVQRLFTQLDGQSFLKELTSSPTPVRVAIEQQPASIGNKHWSWQSTIFTLGHALQMYFLCRGWSVVMVKPSDKFRYFVAVFPDGLDALVNTSTAAGSDAKKRTRDSKLKTMLLARRVLTEHKLVEHIQTIEKCPARLRDDYADALGTAATLYWMDQGVKPAVVQTAATKLKRAREGKDDATGGRVKRECIRLD
jgi:hypothetical protein